MKPAVEDNIAKAMATFIPDLKRDYQEFVRQTLDRAKEELGSGLPHVYSNHRWYRTFQGTLRPNIRKDHPADRPVTYIPKELDKIPYIIDEEKLEKNSQEYAEGTAYQWYGKMVSKLGDLDSVDIHYIQGGNLVLTGNRGSVKIRIDQQRIFKTSYLGTPFHQWPARIYVDGKFTPEAAYKKLIEETRTADTEIRCVVASGYIEELKTGAWKKQLNELTDGTYEVEVYWFPWIDGQEREEHWEWHFPDQAKAERHYSSLAKMSHVRRSNGETSDKSDKDGGRGGVQRTEHVRVSRTLTKGKLGRGRGRTRHDKETGGILEVH